VIRPNASGDDQHRDELTQFQQPASLSKLATPDQSLLPYASSGFGRFANLAV
jgi:hypothetical protein